MASEVTLPTTHQVVRETLNELVFSKRKIIRQASDFGVIDSTIMYLLDGVINMTGVSLEVPVTGMSISGYNFDVSGLIVSDNNFTLFTSPVGGSGNLLLTDLHIVTSGTDSKVFDLVSANGTEALEINRVNFNDCTSLGTLDNYRQVLEEGTGRFGGTPELELVNAMNGYRCTTSIVRGISNIASLFKSGSGLTFSGRFVSDINCDLSSLGALIDFSASNFSSVEQLELQNCFITRQGVIDASDTTIFPNIDHTVKESFWTGNTGLPNTTKYLSAKITSELTTTINTQDVFEVLDGTFGLNPELSHFDMPSNGEFRLLSGNGTYQISGDLIIEGSSNNVINVKVTKSSDGGLTFPDEIGMVTRQINSLVGGRDVAFFPLSFIAILKKDNRLRLEVSNSSGTGNVSAELDSRFIITGI